MTLTVLLSVSVLALVSTARPIEDRGLEVVETQLGEAEDVQNVIKAVLKSHPSVLESKPLQECLDCRHDFQVHLTSVEDQQSFLQSVEDDEVKAVIPIGEEVFHTADEGLLLGILNRLESKSGRNTPVPDDMLDQFTASTLDRDSQVESIPYTTNEDSASTAPIPSSSSSLVVILGFSCIASLLVLACVGVALYIATVVRDSLFRSRTAWDVLPKLEKQGRGNNGGVKGGRDDGDIGYWEKRMIVNGEAESVDETHPSPDTETKAGTLSEKPSLEDLNERFFDCQCDLSNPSVYSTPLIPAVSLTAVSRPSTPTPTLTSSHPPPSSTAAVPASRPQWSLRASESKLPQLPPPSSRSSSTTPPASSVGAPKPDGNRRRAFTAMPELDAALAMQLRPGLGLGAMVDAAWLVRFVMALFGWCAVLMTGRRDRH